MSSMITEKSCYQGISENYLWPDLSEREIVYTGVPGAVYPYTVKIP